MKSVYENLSAVKPLARSYTFKFLFIAFLGIHIPLIGLIVFVLFKPDGLSTFSVLGLTLLLTLGATAVTLAILNGLLTPLRRSRKALSDYCAMRTLPELPTHYPDEAGQLMRNIQFTLTELNDLLEEKKDLTSLLSHDLRTPLRNVKTFGQLLQESSTDAETVKEYAGMIVESAEEQAKLLENILEMMRSDDLFFQTHRNVAVDADGLVDDAIKSLDAAARAKGITLQKEMQYKGAIEVQPELFSQVLKNLAGNAIKFSHKDTAVRIRVYRQDGKTFIDVHDSGIGFTPEAAETLFDRFTKSGRTGTAGEPSTGLGLYLSRKIVRHHQGELTAWSKGDGKGSVFSISLN